MNWLIDETLMSSATDGRRPYHLGMVNLSYGSAGGQCSWLADGLLVGCSQSPQVDKVLPPAETEAAHTPTMRTR
jgi:uncharacterized protein